MFRRTVYATSAAAAVLLIGTLVWNLHQHAVDRGVRLRDGLRDVARL